MAYRSSSPRRTPRTTTQKRLGHDHQIHRARLLDRHADGSPCWWCGRPMYRDRRKNWDYSPRATRKDGKPDTSSGSLAGDHTHARAHNRGTHADRLLHGKCNAQRSDGTRDDQRPALAGELTRPHFDALLGVRVFDWP
jgi:hypothetical protein